MASDDHVAMSDVSVGKSNVISFSSYRSACITFQPVSLLEVVSDDEADTIQLQSRLIGGQLSAEYDHNGMLVRLLRNDDQCTATSVLEFSVTQQTEFAKMTSTSVLFRLEVDSVVCQFQSASDFTRFYSLLKAVRSGQCRSVFDDRTEESSASQYFQFYGYLSQQQNMMQDFTRTSTYQKAIVQNPSNFRNKVVLDVGAGSGILSFFAAHAGAKKVYAVEGSSIAKYAQQLVEANFLSDVIKVVSGKIEEIELDEKVDTIVSEPMGYMLVNERMLETYIHARKWLKPGGKMFPSRGDLHIAPFCDEALYMEHVSKVNFWCQGNFHNVSLSVLHSAALAEYFRQPIVDTFDVRICLAKTQQYVIDFETATESSLHKIDIPLSFHIVEAGTVHGLAFWFDVAFLGSDTTVWLSTSPTEPLTHWYQVRCLLPQPLLVAAGQLMTGHVRLVANAKQSYDVQIECRIEVDPGCSGAPYSGIAANSGEAGANGVNAGEATSTPNGRHFVSTNTLDLKNPFFRYTGLPPQPPPGSSHVSPSEAYWAQMDMQGAKQAVNLVNGMIVDGLGHVSLNSASQQPGQAVVAAPPPPPQQQQQTQQQAVTAVQGSSTSPPNGEMHTLTAQQQSTIKQQQQQQQQYFMDILQQRSSTVVNGVPGGQSVQDMSQQPSNVSSTPMVSLSSPMAQRQQQQQGLSFGPGLAHIPLPCTGPAGMVGASATAASCPSVAPWDLALVANPPPLSSTAHASTLN